jgi:X-Pro dipeptidyl-peptidase C-terminal non-catalytic domain
MRWVRPPPKQDDGAIGGDRAREIIRTDRACRSPRHVYRFAPRPVGFFSAQRPQWLKGVNTGILDEPPVRVSVRPEGSHRAARDWPLPGTTMRRLYLTSGPSGATSSVNDGRLSWEPPTADEDSTLYTYPADHWAGWPGLGNATISPGRPPQNLSNLCSWTTEPLETDLEICGGLVLQLYASSDHVDTQFIVRVVDQAPPSGDIPAAAQATLGTGRHPRLAPFGTPRHRPHPFHAAAPLAPSREGRTTRPGTDRRIRNLDPADRLGVQEGTPDSDRHLQRRLRRTRRTMDPPLRHPHGIRHLPP